MQLQNLATHNTHLLPLESLFSLVVASPRLASPMESSQSPAIMSAAAVAMQVAPPASSSRSRDPRLLGSFDLPASWGYRWPMAFCKDLDGLVSDSNAASAGEPQLNSSRSPVKRAAAQQVPAADEGAAAQESPRKQCYLFRDRRAGRDSAEDGREHKKLRNMDVGGGGGGGKKSGGFSLQLTKQEIEADFVVITGRKPPRRPKKLSKTVQRKIDTLFPGSSLSGVSRDRYKVNEKGGF